jgi:hypothetical protein
MRDRSVLAVWNRAIRLEDEDVFRKGDRALAALLAAHVMIMGDGVQGGVEALSDEEIEAAAEGYRFFGLDEIAHLIKRATAYRFRYDPQLEALLEGFGKKYSRWIPSDSALMDILEQRLGRDPEMFAPA